MVTSSQPILKVDLSFPSPKRMDVRMHRTKYIWFNSFNKKKFIFSLSRYLIEDISKTMNILWFQITTLNKKILKTIVTSFLKKKHWDWHVKLNIFSGSMLHWTKPTWIKAKPIEMICYVTFSIKATKVTNSPLSLILPMFN